MTDIINAVRQFTEAVGCTTDRYNVRQTALYIGLQLEEMAEKLTAMCKSRESLVGDFALAEMVDALNKASLQFKGGFFDEYVRGADRAAMLDADIDLAWVTIGSAFSQGADVEGAAGEVARANLNKLVKCPDCGGRGVITQGHAPDDYWHEPCDCGNGLVAIKDANGKVKKPEGWTPPNIEPFVCKE